MGKLSFELSPKSLPGRLLITITYSPEIKNGASSVVASLYIHYILQVLPTCYSPA